METLRRLLPLLLTECSVHQIPQSVLATHIPAFVEPGHAFLSSRGTIKSLLPAETPLPPTDIAAVSMQVATMFK